MKNKIAAIIMILICFYLSSCQQYTNHKNISNEENTIRIGVMIYRYDDTFIETVRVEIEEYAAKISEEKGISLKINMVDANNQQEIQFDQLQTYIDEAYDVLCINIVDRESAAEMIDMAKKENIPLIFFNREPTTLDMMRWDSVYYVGCDAKQSGQLQGEMVVDYWKSNRKTDKNEDEIMQCVFLKGEPDHQDTLLRTENNLKAFEENNLPIEILATYTANWQRDQAQAKIDTCLEVFGDKVEAIISNNDEMALGAINAIKNSEQYNQAKMLPVFGIDATPVAVEALLNNELAGTVLNDGINQAHGVIDLAIALGLNEDISAFPQMDRGRYYWVDYKIINRDDIQ